MLQRRLDTLRLVEDPAQVANSIESIGRKVASGDIDTLRAIEESGAWNAINNLAMLDLGPVQDVGNENRIRLKKRAMDFCSLWFRVRPYCHLFTPN